VEAHKNGLPFPERVEGELQPQIVESAEFAERAKMALTGIPARLYSKDPHMLPVAGRVAMSLLWMRDEFEAWLRGRLESDA
jgi:hypothetical protein